MAELYCIKDPLLDEVMSGLNMDETRDMIHTVRKIRDTGVTICIIEHVMA